MAKPMDFQVGNHLNPIFDNQFSSFHRHYMFYIPWLIDLYNVYSDTIRDKNVLS